jgi:hypothetical protein
VTDKVLTGGVKSTSFKKLRDSELLVPEHVAKDLERRVMKSLVASRDAFSREYLATWEPEEKKEEMTGISAAPSWAITSLKWLKENGYGSYVSSGITPDVRLLGALRRMCWMKLDRVSGEDRDPEEYSALLTEYVSRWDAARHKEMRAFLESGGYSTEKRLHGVSPAEPGKITLDGAEGHVWVVENGPDGKIPARPEPAAPASEIDDLAAAVLAEAKARDSRHGSW